MRFFEMGSMRFVIETDKSTDEVIGIIKNNTHLDIPLYRVIYDDNVTKKYFREKCLAVPLRCKGALGGSLDMFPLFLETARKPIPAQRLK